MADKRGLEGITCVGCTRRRAPATYLREVRGANQLFEPLCDDCFKQSERDDGGFVYKMAFIKIGE